jgi:hypothetical protein
MTFHTKKLARAQAIKFDVEQRIHDLDLVADKKLELRLMIEAALNPFDMTPDIEWLRDEVALFMLACKGVRA